MRPPVRWSGIDKSSGLARRDRQIVRAGGGGDAGREASARSRLRSGRGDVRQNGTTVGPDDQAWTNLVEIDPGGCGSYRDAGRHR
jgi:hypothetical protein